MTLSKWSCSFSASRMEIFHDWVCLIFMYRERENTGKIGRISCFWRVLVGQDNIFFSCGWARGQASCCPLMFLQGPQSLSVWLGCLGWKQFSRSVKKLIYLIYVPVKFVIFDRLTYFNKCVCCKIVGLLAKEKRKAGVSMPSYTQLRQNKPCVGPPGIKGS